MVKLYKAIIIIILTVALQFNIAGQENQYICDSIFRSLQKLPEKQKIDSVISIAKSEKFSKKDCLDIVDRAIEIAEKIESKEQLFTILILKSNILLRLQKYDEAITNLKLAEPLINKGNLKDKALICLTFGQIYNMAMELDTAKYYLNQALELSTILNDTVGMIKSYVTIGTNSLWRNLSFNALDYFQKAEKLLKPGLPNESFSVLYGNMAIGYQNQGDLTSAIEYQFKALDFEDRPDKIALIYMNIAALYGRIDNSDKLHEYLKKALALILKTDNRLYLGLIYSNLGSSFSALNKLDSSIYYTKLAIQVLTEVGRMREVAINHSNIGTDFNSLKNYDSALIYYKKALFVVTEINDSISAAQVYNKMGESYTLKGNYAKAEEALSTAIGIAQHFRQPNILSEIYENYALLYYKSGDYRKAYDYNEKFSNINDSIISLEQKNKIEELSVQYETREKEQENQVLKQQQVINSNEISKQKTMKLVFFLLSVLLLLSIISIYILLRTRTRFFKLQNEISNEQSKLIQQELEIKKREQLLAEDVTVQLKHDLKYRAGEIERTSSQLLKNSELAGQLLNKLGALRPYCNDEGKKLIMSTLADYTNFSAEHNWETFKNNFMGMHGDFYRKLETGYPDLTTNELRLATFIRLGLKTKDIASITFQSVNSINVAKNRLKNRFEVSSIEDLNNFLVNL